MPAADDIRFKAPLIRRQFKPTNPKLFYFGIAEIEPKEAETSQAKQSHDDD